MYQPSRALPSGKVVLVKIDNESLDSLTKSDFRVLTFSKGVIIDVIKTLRKEGAKSIGLDIVLANPDPREEELSRLLDEKEDIVIAAKVGVGSE